MTWFSNIGMARKLTASFMLVALLSGVVGSTAYSALTTTHYWLSQIATGSVPGLVRVLTVQKDVSLIVRSHRGALIATDPAQARSYLALARTARAELDANFGAYVAGSAAPTAHEAATVRQARDELRVFLADETRIEQLITSHTRSTLATADQLSTGAQHAVAIALDGRLDQLVRGLQAEVTSRTAAAAAAQSGVIAQLLTVVVGAMLLAVILGLLIARSIAGPLGHLTGTAAAIARGDTDATIDLERGDELGVLAQSLRLMVANLRDRTRAASDAEERAHASEAHTRESADQLARAVTRLIDEIAPAAEGNLTVRPRLSADAGDVAVVADFTGVLIDSFADVARLVRDASAQAQANGAQLTARVQQLLYDVQERAVQVNETAAVAEQIADSATDVLASVEQVNNATREAVGSVAQGNAAVAQTLERMDTVRGAMIQATRQIKRLSDSSLVMNSTVGLVLQFAGDLELLADNAQIEAARHEAGGVFTAVAEQTGRLAEDAQKALTDIQAAVHTNRQETAEVGRQMEQAATEVVASARAVEEARAAFANITHTVHELDGFVERVSAAAAGQVDVARAVNAAMGQIIRFFDQMADGIRLSEADVAKLRRTIDCLQASIANLRIDADEVTSAPAGISAGRRGEDTLSDRAVA